MLLSAGRVTTAEFVFDAEFASVVFVLVSASTTTSELTFVFTFALAFEFDSGVGEGVGVADGEGVGEADVPAAAIVNEAASGTVFGGRQTVSLQT